MNVDLDWKHNPESCMISTQVPLSRRCDRELVLVLYANQANCINLFDALPVVCIHAQVVATFWAVRIA